LNDSTQDADELEEYVEHNKHRGGKVHTKGWWNKKYGGNIIVFLTQHNDKKVIQAVIHSIQSALARERSGKGDVRSPRNGEEEKEGKDRGGV